MRRILAPAEEVGSGWWADLFAYAIKNAVDELDGFRCRKFAGNFECFIDDDGTRGFRIAKKLGYGLDDSAKRAILATKFEPATDASGTPIAWDGIVNDPKTPTGRDSRMRESALKRGNRASSGLSRFVVSVTQD